MKRDIDKSKAERTTIPHFRSGFVQQKSLNFFYLPLRCGHFQKVAHWSPCNGTQVRKKCLAPPPRASPSFPPRGAWGPGGLCQVPAQGPHLGPREAERPKPTAPGAKVCEGGRQVRRGAWTKTKTAPCFFFRHRPQVLGQRPQRLFGFKTTPKKVTSHKLARGARGAMGNVEWNETRLWSPRKPYGDGL